MSGRALGGVLLVAGGVILAAAGFFPWGEGRTHWVVFSEAAQRLAAPDPDNPLIEGEALLFGVQIVGLGYPALAGTAFALTPLVGRFRVGFWALGLVHPASAGVLAAMGTALAASQNGRQHALWLVVLASFLALVALLEVRGLLRASRYQPSAHRLERAAMGPALFLLAINLSCLVYLVRYADVWPLTAYWMGSAASGLVALGSFLRAPRRRRAEGVGPAPVPTREPAGVA